MKAITVIEANEAVGKTVTVRGWVHTVRDMGKITFVDLRDQTGLLQIVVPGTMDAPRLGVEYVVEIEGEVRQRGERFVNPKLATGGVELGASSVKILNESAELPFEVKNDTIGIHEELRLKYRYLDLRSERMAGNLRLRHRVNQFIRNYLDKLDFIEVETPILGRGTPEGSREFLVPSRLHPEEFYVLPQSPQQYKQLLMVAGLGRYYQIAHIFRDEDQRADRQSEAVQLDLEMSFVEQEDILGLLEPMLIDLIKTLAPTKAITSTPFPRIAYAESLKKYGSDKPDLRKDSSNHDELAFVWIVDFPMFEIGTESKVIEASHHPFTSPNTADIHLLDSEPLKARAIAFDLVLNGVELLSGSIRIHSPELQQKVFSILGLSEAEVKSKFGHMIEAFSFGAPPHGGIGMGMDRLVMKLASEENIREVMAFPKTGDVRDPLMGAPSKVSEQALDEAHIKTALPKKA